MKYLDSQSYVEVEDHRYKNHPIEKIILGLRDESKSLKIQNHVQNETLIRKNQKFIKFDNGQIKVKIYPKNKQPMQQQQKVKPPNGPSC